MERYNKDNFSIDMIKEALQEFLRDKKEKGEKTFLDYTPKEISPGCWQIGDLMTGDGGKDIFDEAVREDQENFRKLLIESRHLYDTDEGDFKIERMDPRPPSYGINFVTKEGERAFWESFDVDVNDIDKDEKEK